VHQSRHDDAGGGALPHQKAHVFHGAGTGTNSDLHSGNRVNLADSKGERSQNNDKSGMNLNIFATEVQ
jgi:hypothetical protein